MAKNLVMLALIALVAIEHDGETVAPGEVFELDEKQAQPLIDVGAARLQEPADEPEAGGPSGDPASGDGGTGDGSAGDSGAGDGAGNGGNAGNGGKAAKTTSKKR